MSWQCFGWAGAYCHTGTQYFTSEQDGLCIEDHDQDYDPQTYPFTIYFVVLNQPSIQRLGRVMVAFFEGVEYYRAGMNNSWTWGQVNTKLEGVHNNGRYKFELQDGAGRVLCTKSLYVGELIEEPIVIDEPEESDIDYDRIVEGNALIVNTARDKAVSEINENQGLINGVQNSITDMNDGLSGQVISHSSEVKKLLGESTKGLSGRLDNLLDSVTGGIKGVSDKIEELQFPNIGDIKYAFMDVCADLAKALWDAILDKIEERYPDDDKESD